MPTIHVELFAGRTDEQKSALAAKITAACVETIGSGADSVDIIFVDVARNNWATGGVLWSTKAAIPQPAS